MEAAAVIAVLRDFTDRVLGRGEAAITVPPFDGALKPNQLLEGAAVVAQLDAPDDLATNGRSVFASDGPRLLHLDGSALNEVQRFDRTITALTCLPDGGFAVAFQGREICIQGGKHDGTRWSDAAGKPFCAVNALSPAPNGKLLATDGSATQPCDKWSHDLMELGRTGRILELDCSTGAAREVAAGLSYAFGACSAGEEIWVCESWRHRLLRYGAGRSGAVLDRLPGYPSRITAAAGGGFWLSVFAARTQLVEFVLRETAFRKRMMAEIEPEYWIAPTLISGRTFLEPMQGAHIKTMGILKPWAPPRSYGLVIRLSPEGLPRYSFHSRVDGKNHGVVAAVECGGNLFVLAKGSRRLLRLDIADAERRLLA
jgi:hypothetical protein